MNCKIPKIIHYCWFGRGEKSQLVKKCMESWKTVLPDYQIKEWNEENFDLNNYVYAREAYESKKYAFVADVARLHALASEGGLYFDTDIEVIRKLDKFLGHCAFAGFEDGVNIQTGILASEKGGTWVTENLKYYKDRHFIGKDGNYDMRTNVYTVTKYLVNKGLRQDDSYQEFEDLIAIYPQEYFCPLTVGGRKLKMTMNTHTIHHFTGSWGNDSFMKRCYKYVKYRIVLKTLPDFFIRLIVEKKDKVRSKKAKENFEGF